MRLWIWGGLSSGGMVSSVLGSSLGRGNNLFETALAVHKNSGYKIVILCLTGDKCVELLGNGLGRPMVWMVFPNMDLYEIKCGVISSSFPPICKNKYSYLFSPKTLS